MNIMSAMSCVLGSRLILNLREKHQDKAPRSSVSLVDMDQYCGHDQGCSKADDNC